MNLAVEFAGLKMRYLVMNASGIFSFPPALKRLAPYFGAVVTKSIGIEERDGYETPVFAQLSHEKYINAVGLSNPGYREMRKELEEVYPIFCDGHVPLIVSIFGSSDEELVTIAMYLEDVCDAFEINYSCPHPKPGERVGMVLGSDPCLVYDYTKAVCSETRRPVVAKLSPNIANLSEVARAAIDGGAGALSAINTIGPEEARNEYGLHILSNKKGGVSGKCIRIKGLDVVRRLRQEFPDVPIIGMGGIYTAEDVAEYLYSGADAVAMGTAFDLMSAEDVGRYMNDLYRKLREMGV